ncbi:MAG: substrate-binding domain-containing protein [Spirochaetota bacterium]
MKKTVIILFSFLLILALTLPLFSAGKKETKAKETLTFAFVPGIADPFYYTMEKGIRQKAQEQTLAALQANPDIVGAFGTNLYSAQGLYQAVVNAGLTGAVKIASWDATEDLINALKGGKVDLVLAQKPAEIGALAVEWGYKYFKEKAGVPKKVIPGFEFFTRDNVSDPNMQQFIYKK